MILSKKELKCTLKYENDRLGVKKYGIFLGFFNLSEIGIIWKYTKRLRKYEYHLNKKYTFISKYCHYKLNKISLRYGMFVVPNSVEKGMVICHLGPIIIRDHIGENSVIHINTALVGGGKIDSTPICENNLYLGIGSTIVGNVSVVL